MFYYSVENYSCQKTNQKEDIIKGICPVGLTLLFGPEKVGKSLLVRSLSLALVDGSQKFLEYKISRRGNVVYFALDDSETTLHNRFDDTIFSNFFIVTTKCFLEAQRYGSQYSKIGYVFQILDSIIKNEGPVVLVIIDTLEKIRNADSKRDYAHEVEDLNALKVKAEELGINILLVHHSTKNTKLEPLQNYYGSKGIGAEVDVLIAINNTTDQKIQSLMVTGNNLPKKEILVSKNTDLNYQIETMNREDLIQDVPEKALIQLIKFCTKNAQSSPYRKFHWVGMFPDLITEADLDIPPKNVGRLLKDNEKQLLECHISFSICRRKYGMVATLDVDRSNEVE